MTSAVIEVTTTADEFDSDAGCSLREAIQAANTDTAFGGCPAGSGADTIILPAGTYGLTRIGSENLNANNDLDILSDLTISGAGADTTVIRNSYGTDRVLEIIGATVEINDVTLTGGHERQGYFGGGIKNSGTLTLNNSTVSGNTSKSHGGGIYSSGDLTLNNSTVSGNTAYLYGGGIYSSGDLTLNNSAVSGNTAYLYGGGIYSSGDLTLNNSTVSGNTSKSHGGGIYSSGDLTLNNSTVVSNTAESGPGYGGGIYSSGDLTLNNSTVSGNTAYLYGGGIYSSGDLTLNNSTVSGNTADYGGGIGTTTTMTMTNSTVSGNTADTGGGIYRLSGAARAKVKNTIIANNVATSSNNCYLAQVDSLGHNLESGDDCGFDQATDLVNTDPLLGSLQDNGGPTLTHALLVGSPAIDAGSCTDVDGNPVDTDQRGFERPQGSGCDIGAFEGRRSAEIQVNIRSDEFGESGVGLGCSLREAVQAANSDCEVGGCPGGIGADTIILPAGTYELTIAGADEDNNATGDLDILDDLTINGAGADTTVIDANDIDRVVHVHSGQTVTVNDVTITGGQTPSGDNGGGIENSGMLTLNNSPVSNNFAGNAGGGVENSGTLTVTNSTLSDNSAANAGGGIHNDGGDVTVTNSALSGNSAVYGGGIENSGTLMVTNSTLSDNSAANAGGGIATGSTMTIINSTISSNDAAQGGGIHSAGGNTSIQFTTIAFNTGSSGGANVHNDGGTVELFASIIADPQPLGASNCDPDGVGLTSAGAGGYNRISDTSCDLQNIGAEDRENVTIELGPLAGNGGPTLTHRPAPHEEVVDIMPRGVCESFFDGLGLDRLDQRGKGRPAWGIREEGVVVVESEWKCDAGVVELGAETRLVCGPPLTPIGDFPQRCTYDTIGKALQEAQTGDTIVVSGVVTETVTVSKSVTIRGPAIQEATPGTHIGIVQATSNEPDGDQSPGSVFTIIAGPSVTIEHLNIRHGDADQGGGINNAADLTLDGVTIYASHAISGGAVYNSGTLRVTNSTIVGNTASSGAGIYSASTATVIHVTLADNDGSSIHNGGTPGSVVVSGTILSAPGSGSQCTGDVTSDGYNLVDGPACFATAGTGDATGDPQLGPLRDNGGPTLTRAISADSAAVEAGPLEADCAVETDQRGKTRPFDMPGGGGARCDVGAVEYGPDTLTVCENCDPDPDELRFDDLQEALDRAIAGDTIAVEAGAYTGNFIAYKDVTLQHAGIDVATLGRDQSVDVRAILQASERTIREQHRLLDPTQASGLSGTVLTVEAFCPTDATIAPSDDVTVTIQDLTIRHGLSRQGGGIYNVGHLTIIRSTISENAAVNELQEGITVTVEAQGGAIYNVGQLTLERSTVSGNQSESYGGAIYTAGSASQDASVDVVASTIADNKAEKLPRQYVINITDEGFDPSGQTVDSGDEIQF